MKQHTTFKFKNKYDVKVSTYPCSGRTARHTTLVLMPAMGVAIKKYQRLIQGLTDAGYTVIAADYPCCGDNHPQVNKHIDYSYSDLVHDFIPQLIRTATDSHTVLLGHSIGAHIATLYATKHHIDVIGIATGNIHYKNWTGLAKLNIFCTATLFRLMTQTYGYFPGYKVGFANKEPKSLMQDWCHTAWTGNYDFFDKHLSKATGKGLYLHIQGDTFAPLTSTTRLAQLFADYQVKTIALLNAPKGNKHSIWLKEPSLIVTTIAQHLQQQAH